jgi:hypothetical protein
MMMIKTNKDLRELEGALVFLANLTATKDVKPTVFNAFQFRIGRCLQTYKPAITTLREAEQKAIETHNATTPDEKSKAAADRELEREMNELHKLACDVPEKLPATFVLADFTAAGIAVPAAVLTALGPLFEWPPEEETGE